MPASTVRIQADSGQIFQVFTPQIGATPVTALTATAASARAALGTVDGGGRPCLMNIRGPSGGRVRLAFFTADSGSAGSTSLLVGYADDWEAQIGVPPSATHYAVVRADGADVGIEISWQ